MLFQFFNPLIVLNLTLLLAKPSRRVCLWEHIKYELTWEHCTDLDELRAKLKQVLNSLSSEAIASLCGWDYITNALLSATS
jgi:hypothetical protein